jgi:hypothetical protein
MLIFVYKFIDKNKAMVYSIEVCSIDGGTDILQWHKRKTKSAALKLAMKLSKKHNAEGLNSEGWIAKEKVYVDAKDERGGLKERYLFIDGVQEYYSDSY